MTSHRSPDHTLQPVDGDALVAIGGYVHPLFTDPSFPVVAGFAARPWPGQALLLLMGGLAEQSDAYGSETLALLGFEEIDFLAPAVDGDVVHVEIEPLPLESTRVTRWRWQCVRADGTLLVNAVARFLRRNP
jgi:acyl dehydratase